MDIYEIITSIIAVASLVGVFAGFFLAMLYRQ
jgi:uncharacterized protein YneF (UPF0154 family)